MLQYYRPHSGLRQGRRFLQGFPKMLCTLWVKVILLRIQIKANMARLPILMYHNVVPDGSKGLTISVKNLESQMAYLSEKGYGALHFRSEEHTSELQSRPHLVCRLLLEKKKHKK